MKKTAVVIIIALLVCSFAFARPTRTFADESQTGAAQQSAGGEEASSGAQDAERLTIDEAGVYTLTGSMTGTVYVDPGVGDVTLILDDVDIRAGKEPAIMAVSGDSLTIKLKDNSCNAISDSKENAKEAALYTEVDTVLEGRGCLQINGNCKYGVLAENAALTFACKAILIVSESSGIKSVGEKPVSFNSGYTFINAKQDQIIDAADIRTNGGKYQASKETKICNICGCCGMKNHCMVCVTQWVLTEADLCGEACSCCTPTTDTPGEIIEGIMENSAEVLVPDPAGAIRFVFTEDTGNIQIAQAGTFDITGTSGNGSITVAQGTEGVVLILHDLNLAGSSGAVLRIGSDAEVQIHVEGSVVLADNSGAAADGAAIKGEDGIAVFLTGDGNLKVTSTSGNGIQAGEDSSLVIDGGLKIDITAAKDGIFSENDAAIREGSITVSAGGDGIHADHILTIGENKNLGPTIKIAKSTEGMEANVVNIKGGDIEITAEEDGVEAEKDDAGNLNASVNVTGGSLVINAEGNAIDSDGNINLINGSAKIDSEGPCVDFDGDLYVSSDFELDCNCEGSEAEVWVPVVVCVETPVITGMEESASSGSGEDGGYEEADDDDDDDD